MAVDMQMVKRLREETDAPFMECKSALEEASGDYEKAKELLREKGKAAAVKRADRSTAAGVVAFSTHHDHKMVGAVALETETDFVARNEGFIALANELAEIFLHNDPGTDPLAVQHGDKTVGTLIEEGVAKFRENIKLTSSLHLKTENEFSTYIHHDLMKGVVIELKGTGDEARQVARDIAIQSVAFPPKFISKDEVPQEFIDNELKIETERAINEGKNPDIAKNIAMGRVNKEFMKQVVLLEQPFFRDQNVSVSEFLKQESNKINQPVSIVRLVRVAVGEGAVGDN